MIFQFICTPISSRHSSGPWEKGLANAARTLRNLLRDVDSASEPLWEGPQLDAAIFRYTEIFLPMLAAHLGSCDERVREISIAANTKRMFEYFAVRGGSMYQTVLTEESEKDEFLAPFKALPSVTSVAPIPPLDVAFCWALHRLSSMDYERDCKRLFGMKLETPNGLEYVNVQNCEDERSIIARFQWSCFARTIRRMEKRTFPRIRKRCIQERKTFLPQYLLPRYIKDDNDSTLHDFAFKDSSSWAKKRVNPIEFDVVAAAKRQKQFLFNISHSYFDEDESLKTGAYRYKRFLALIRDSLRDLFPAACLVVYNFLRKYTIYICFKNKQKDAMYNWSLLIFSFLLGSYFTQ